MQRDLVQSVSSPLPVLLPEDQKRDGWAHLVLDQPWAAWGYADKSGILAHSMAEPVRVVTNEEILRLTRDEKALIGAMKLLLTAEQRNDIKAAENAYTLLIRPLWNRSMSAQRFQEIKRGLLDKFQYDSSIGDRKWLNIVISHTLARARLVAWTQYPVGTAPGTKIFRSGLGVYCPDPKTAMAVKMLLGDVRICLRCQKTFLPKHPNQYCCSVECRERHRLARWRARKNAEAAKRKPRKDKLHAKRPKR